MTSVVAPVSALTGQGLQNHDVQRSRRFVAENIRRLAMRGRWRHAAVHHPRAAPEKSIRFKADHRQGI
jgi:hypothetical protein